MVARASLCWQANICRRIHHHRQPPPSHQRIHPANLFPTPSRFESRFSHDDPEDVMLREDVVCAENSPVMQRWRAALRILENPLSASAAYAQPGQKSISELSEKSISELHISLYAFGIRRGRVKDDSSLIKMLTVIKKVCYIWKFNTVLLKKTKRFIHESRIHEIRRSRPEIN